MILFSILLDKVETKKKKKKLPKVLMHHLTKSSIIMALMFKFSKGYR